MSLSAVLRPASFAAAAVAHQWGLGCPALEEEQSPVWQLLPLAEIAAATRATEDYDEDTDSASDDEELDDEPCPSWIEGPPARASPRQLLAVPAPSAPRLLSEEVDPDAPVALYLNPGRPAASARGHLCPTVVRKERTPARGRCKRCDQSGAHHFKELALCRGEGCGATRLACGPWFGAACSRRHGGETLDAYVVRTGARLAKPRQVVLLVETAPSVDDLRLLTAAARSVGASGLSLRASPTVAFH